MDWLIFVAVLVVLFILGLIIQAVEKSPAGQQRAAARRAELAAQGLKSCPTCKGSGRIWDPTRGTWNPKFGGNSGASGPCYTCGGRGVVKLGRA
jgi:DnaJ-class molecular chaperone